MSGFIIEATITGPQATIGEFRIQFLELFPVIKKDSSQEIIVILSGGDLDPRPTLLNLSGEFPTLTFSVAEYSETIEETLLSDSWTLRDGNIMRDGRDR